EQSNTPAPCSAGRPNEGATTPAQHGGADLLPQLDGVDQEHHRSRPLALPREEAKPSHEPAIAHARRGRQPAQLQNVIPGPDDDSPRVLHEFGSHEGSSMGRPRTPSPTATCAGSKAR